MDFSKLTDFTPDTPSRSRDDSVTKAASMVAIQRPDLNGEQIATFLKANGYPAAKGPFCGVVAGNVRALWSQLTSGNPVAILAGGDKGKRYVLRVVEASEVRKEPKAA